MKNKVLGGIGILWGGGILFNWLNGGGGGGGAYGAGQDFAAIFGLVMFLAGVHYLFNKKA